MDMDMDTDPVAGPSTLPTQTPPAHPPPPVRADGLLLRPELPSARPAPLHGAEDLLGRLGLSSAYARFVGEDGLHHGEVVEGKGKGKERERGDDEDEDGDWRRKKGYRYLIKDVPGRHSVRRPRADESGENRSAMKDLQDFVLEPEKQIIGIGPFERGERDPWHVSDEGIRNWSLNFLQAESSAHREERKRKKELKKQAKQASAPSTPTTPLALQQQQQQQANTRGGTPATPATAAPPPPLPAPKTAGIKRERDVDSLPSRPQPNGAPPGPGMVQTPNGAGMGGRAGVDGVRPRPKKKQRLDSQGHARDMQFAAVQQPTPQGV
ncbi:hypothetical protein PENSPDRAFT_687446 [Peniophora sp. CONT]|nr:hypothetical protein PENSPDRAFT_687446 [Peniophora sp. CONT]